MKKICLSYKLFLGMLALLCGAACQGDKGSFGSFPLPIPDEVSGVLLDRMTGEPIEGVSVKVRFDDELPRFLGPEGTTKTGIKEFEAGVTDQKGEFRVDLRDAKRKLVEKHPGVGFYLGSFNYSKAGYVTLLENYKKPNETYTMKRSETQRAPYGFEIKHRP